MRFLVVISMAFSFFLFQAGKRAQLTSRAASDIEAGELEHKLVAGFFDDGVAIGIKVQELASFG